MTLNRRQTLGYLAGSSMASLLVAPAMAAEPYPHKPVRVVVPYPPGGPSDILTRVLVTELTNQVGQQLFIDNRAGASGLIGSEYVAHAEPDGYTLLENASIHVITPSLNAQMRINPFKDFVPVTQFAEVPLLLVVPTNSPFKSVADIVQYGKQNQGKLNFASGGSASAMHLAGEWFKTVAGIDMSHVPYKGSGPALVDVVGGQVHMMFDAMASVMPLIRGGKLRALAVTTQRRVKDLPDLPTVAESGFPNFDISTWYGLWAPRGTPDAIVTTLADGVARALKSPAVSTKFADMGAIPVGSSPADFARYVESEGRKWAAIVKAAGLTPQ